MLDKAGPARNEDFYQPGFGAEMNTKGRKAESSSSSANKGAESPDTISKQNILGISLNSCIKQDEEISDLNQLLKGTYSTEYEYRPESFEVKILSGYFPTKIKQAIINNLQEVKLSQRDCGDKRSLAHRLSDQASFKSKTLNHHSIFYVYNDNEIVLWNWSKDDPVYSVQTEEFFQENTKKKAPITSVAPLEDENSSFIKILVSTEYYIVMLSITRNMNGNYIINRMKDSFYSLSGYHNISLNHAIVHQASGRFFLGCGNTGTVYEYTMEQERSWVKRRAHKISGLVYGLSQGQNDANFSHCDMTHSLARLVNISGNPFISYLPGFIRNRFFGRSHHAIKSMFVDEFRGLLYVLYRSSDIDVFLVPLGSFSIKKVSDDLTYIEKGDPPSAMDSLIRRYFASDGSSTGLSSPVVTHLFRVNIATIRSEIGRIVNSSNSKKQSVSGSQQKKSPNIASNLSIHSVHPTNPQESDIIYVILVTSHGDRIYLESVFESGNRSGSSYSWQGLSFPAPVGFKVKEFKKTTLGSEDSEEQLVSSSTYSNGVSILTTINMGDGLDLPESMFSKRPEMSLNEIPESLNEGQESIFSWLTSSISASCIDQTTIARCLSNRNMGAFNIQNVSPYLSEWQYSFSDPNLGLILSVQERNVPSKYQRLFENLWNTPNPYLRGSSQGEMVYLRPNISSLSHDKLLSSNNLVGFGCRTSGSRFFHLWRYFFNRLSSRPTPKSGAKEESRRHCLAGKSMSSAPSCSVLGISQPLCPPNGLNDLVLDQVAECRSWTIITTKGIFVLEKKRLLDIITRMTLEPQNYSFMMNVFDNQESFSPMARLGSYGGVPKEDGLQNGRSAAFVMRLLGTFAQTITFEQFFALVWQGLVGMNTKGVLDSELIQKFFSSEMKNDSPLEIHIRNMEVGMFEKRFQQGDFPSVTLIKIWLTLLSDMNIQSKSNSSCYIGTSSVNHRLGVTPRFKGLLLFIARVIRSIWGIPLFQQANFEILGRDSHDIYGYMDQEGLREDSFLDPNGTMSEMELQDHSENKSESRFVSEFIKSQIERSERQLRPGDLLSPEGSMPPRSSSCKNKDVVLDIRSCIHEFFKYEASEWLSHNQIDASGASGPASSPGRTSKAAGLISENNTKDFATNDSVSVLILSSLTEDHISHLRSNLIPINSLLDLLLPWWFPNYSLEASRVDEEEEVVLTNHYSASSSLGSSSNIYSLISVSELQLFIEIKNFVSRTIEILEMMNLFCRTYPLGIRYNARVADEAVLCSSYMDILKKSMTEFTLFELASNKRLQFVLRLLFRYGILSASQYMSSLDQRSRAFLIPSPLMAVEHCISSLNREIIAEKRSKSYQEVLSNQRSRALVSSKKTKGNEQTRGYSHSQIMYILFEQVYEIPLNIVLNLLYHKKEISSIISLVNSQSEYIHQTGLLPPWLSNGEKVEVYTPTSISEFSSHLSDSNPFIRYFLSILLFEINKYESQYSSSTGAGLMSFQEILVNFEQSGCKTLLEFCKSSSQVHAIRSIYTYEFHCSLWVYQNLQNTLDIIYNEYVIEIERLLSRISLIDDPAYDYLRELEVSLNPSKSPSSPSEQKNLEDRLCVFKPLKDDIMHKKSSIIEFILSSLKLQESDYRLKFNKLNQKSFVSTCKEWLHYYLFSYVSYTDSCMQKTIQDEINSRKGGKRLENWLIKNLCISVFEFSEHSVYLKNWLEHFHLNDDHSYYLRGVEESRRVEESSRPGLVGSSGRVDDGHVMGSRSDNYQRGGVRAGSGQTIDQYNDENSLRNDQGYLLYNAKQYLSAGQHYYSKSKAIWRIPLGVSRMIARTQGEILKSASRGGLSYSPKLKDVNRADIAKMQDYMRKSLESYKRGISSSSSIQGGKRLEAIFDLLSDIHAQVLRMQQDPTLIQRRSLLLQSQTCIERDMNDDKNKEFIRSIRSDIFNIDSQMEILLQIAEFINYYILSALEQNVNINPLVKQIFDLFDASTRADDEMLYLDENLGISQEGVDIFKSLIMGIFHIQSMVHTNETLMEFITEFYSLTGFSSVTVIKWLIENSRDHPGIIAQIVVKIPSLCEYRTKQAFFLESPILFEVDMAELLRLCENSVPYDLVLHQNCRSIKGGLNSRLTVQQFDSILETIVLELYKFSILYYNQFRQNDLVDIYSFEDVTQVKSRVLWWVWPVRFVLFHLSNKSIASRLLALFSGNSNNSSILSNMIGNHERMEISEIIKTSIA
ncbi:putative non-repetitive/WGA-negative nucleoporin [Cryptosporidium canis]|nr:putative non-repetitive/WGA-negative nucleoporin [Cryptosporidium canis]